MEDDPSPVLLVDDDARALLSACATLRAGGIPVVHALSDSREVLPFLSGTEVALLVISLAMPDLSATDLLPLVRAKYADLSILVVTGAADLETAEKCVKAGAADYLVKPIAPNRFVSAVRRVLEMRVLRREVAALQEHLLSPPPEGGVDLHGIRTRERTMQVVFGYVKAIAPSNRTVLITGEPGVGKETVARAVHELSGRTGPFVAVNVSGLDGATFSDTLFGPRRGAFAVGDDPGGGAIARAEGGTLFLNGIGDLSEQSQAALLRFLVERPASARIVCATHHNLREMTAAGQFRHNLCDQLHTHHVHIPPLRDRKDDIPLLLDRFLDEATEAGGKKKPAAPPELLTLLSAYHFPENVRELKTMVFDAVRQLRSGTLSLGIFKKAMERRGPNPPHAFPSAFSPRGDAPFALYDRFPTLHEAEDYLIAEALRRARNNQGIAAVLLGMTRQALNKRLTRAARSEKIRA